MQLFKNGIKLCLCISFLFGGIEYLRAQTILLSGKVIDNDTKQPLIGAETSLIFMSDSTQKIYAVTNTEGYFSIPKLKKGEYKFSIKYLGYVKYEKTISVVLNEQSVGTVALFPKTEELKGVTIVGNTPQAQLKGDTTEFNANSFKVTKDAVAEDLVKKMPGVTVEDGTIKAQGEDVKKVLVDGKPFFGDDPTLALRNLPAEIIEKVQVFDQQSEQSQLTGFNDGQTLKTMNIVTRSNSRNGQFGRFVAAYGDQDRYSTNLNINTFKSSQRLTAIINSNNINQQNFATSDFLGAMGGMSVFGNRNSGGGGGRMGGGGRQSSGMSSRNMGMSSFMSGSQNGISRINSVGLNYSNSFGDRLNISGSYFFNNNRNTNEQISSTENILNLDSSRFDYLNGSSNSNNFNNRMNMRIEWNIDSLNSLIVIPSINFQSNKSGSENNTIQSISYLENISDRLSSAYNSNTRTNGYNISNRVIYRHKFNKSGRTVSADINTSFNERVPNSNSISDVKYFYNNSSLYTDRLTNTMNSSYSINTNIAYTEPVGKISIIQVNVANSFSKTYAYKKTSVFDQVVNEYFKIDTLSNKYLNYFVTNKLGLTYRLKGTNYIASAGFEVQSSGLSGDQTYPHTANTNKRYINVLPNIQYNYRVSRQHNVIINYKTSTDPPSISQLQNVAEYSSDFTRVNIGNPNLEPQYQHNITSRLIYVNRESGSNFFVLFGGTLSQNSIGNSVVYKDTIQVVMPVNRGTGYNFRSMVNYGFPVKFIRSNMNISGGYNFNKTPGFVNGKENIAITNSLIQSLVISSNISDKLDFTLSTSGNYSIVKNSVNTATNNNYYLQTSNFRLNWIFWKGFTLQGEVLNRFYRGLSSSGYNQGITTVNMGLGRKFLKNQAAEMRFSVNDVFNKNTSITRTVNGNQITDQQSNTLHRFFLVSFIYTFRNFKTSDYPQGNQ